MAVSNLTNVAFLYKRLFSDRQVGDLTTRRHPLFKMIGREGGLGGDDSFTYAIRYGNPQGVSNSFANSQTHVNTSKGVKPAMARKIKYATIEMDGVSLLAARGNKSAFLELVKTETNGVLEEMGDALAFDLYRNGDGIRGRRSSASTNVITLTTADDVRNFKIGMAVGASANADGSSARTGNTTVAEVSYSAGTVTLTSAAGITSFADNDYMFRVGEENGTCIEGLSSHFPLTAPSSGESWRGIDRSAHEELLAGTRIDDTATTAEENSGLVAVQIASASVSKKPDCVFLNPLKFWEVCRRTNAKVVYEGGGMNAKWGFEGIDVVSPAGTLRMISDPDCPTNRGYVISKSTLYIKHLEGFPHIIKDDSLVSLRKTSTDAIEARARAIGNLVCTEPGANGVFSI